MKNTTSNKTNYTSDEFLGLTAITGSCIIAILCIIGYAITLSLTIYPTN